MPLGLTKGKSMTRVYDFSPGPAMLPAPLLERAREELQGWRSTGVSVMEMSHRGKDFIGIAEKAEAPISANYWPSPTIIRPSFWLEAPVRNSRRCR